MDIQKIRQDFPILGRTVYGKPLVYLDNAATTQKPRCVIEAITREYYSANANVHRGVHFLSQQATELHEAAREAVRRFIHARSTNEIVFTRGTTESINLVAGSFGEAFMQEGDEVIVSQMEHHSNIVPWQLLQGRKGIRLNVIPVSDSGELDLQAFAAMLSPRTRLVSIAHVSNVLGTVNPVEEIIRMSHEAGAAVLVDGAQSTPHIAIDVQQLEADFYAFSGHKLYGPTGIGVLYGKEEWLRRLPPYQGGGEMIKHVRFSGTDYEEPPLRFEAGTPDYIGTHALACALEYIETIGIGRIARHEQQLLDYATERLSAIPGLRIYGQAPHKSAVLSFLVGEIHPFDLGTLLDRLGIAVRTGHHCAQPLMERYGIPGTVRASFAFYNTLEEVDALAEGIERVRKMF